MVLIRLFFPIFFLEFLNLRFFLPEAKSMVLKQRQVVFSHSEYFQFITPTNYVLLRDGPKVGLFT
jgi:hypothetical protein